MSVAVNDDTTLILYMHLRNHDQQRCLSHHVLKQTSRTGGSYTTEIKRNRAHKVNITHLIPVIDF